MRDTIFDCFSVQSFNAKMAEKHLEWHKEVFQGTEERKLVADSVDGDEEIQLPEGIQKRCILAWYLDSANVPLQKDAHVANYLFQVDPSCGRTPTRLTCPLQVYLSTEW
jgi:hypothetical protein